MDYSLAKQLKDAGFPQRESGSYWTKDGITRIHAYEEHDKDELGLAYIPTLEELIEACRPCNLNVFSDGTQRASFGGIFGDGSTPTEAVAKLWIALHPKPLPTSTE